MTYKGIDFNGTERTWGSNNQYKMWLNFFEAETIMYLSNRMLMLVYTPDGSFSLQGSSYVFPNEDHNGANYYTDKNGYCIVDLTDYMRVCAGSVWGTDMTIYFSNSVYDDLFTGTYTRRLISPYDDHIIPYQQAMDIHTPIAPPSKMYISTWGTLPIKLEIYRDQSYSLTLEQYIGSTLNSTRSLTDGQITLDSAAITSIVLKRSNTYQYKYPLLALQCDHEYALVEWMSFTGEWRRHTFEVRKVKKASADNYSLLTLDNSFDEVKGRTESLTLFLDGLSAYDFWYYSDLITSSKVFVYMKSVRYNTITRRQVKVTTNDMTTPDGNAFDGKIEINVNWKRYDAVAL